MKEKESKSNPFKVYSDEIIAHKGQHLARKKGTNKDKLSNMSVGFQKSWSLIFLAEAHGHKADKYSKYARWDLER